MKTKKIKKGKSKVTVAEFRIWLEGLSAFQPTDWTPTAEQWKVIKDKIDSLLEEQVVIREEVQPQRFPVQGAQRQPQHVQQPQQPQQVQMEPRPNMSVPVQHSSLMDAPGARDGNSSAPIVENLTSRGPDSSGKVFRTGNIDTSKGYDSGFK